MDKDLYIELLENEMRRIRAGADVTHSLVEYQKLRERYAQCEMDIYNRDEEIQDLKLENDHLKKRNEIMVHFLRSIRCQGVFCDKCDLSTDDGCYWINNRSCKKMWDMIDSVFKKLEDL